MLKSSSAAARSQIIVVEVGPDRTRYILHKELLIHHSGLFRREISQNPKKQSFALEDIFTEEFSFFVDWLYEKKLPSSAQTTESWLAFYAYMVADRLSVIRLKVALMDAIFHELSSRSVSSDMVCRLFEALPKNDPLLQLVVDAICINDGIGRMGTESLVSIDNLSKEYLTRVMRKFHHLNQLPEKERNLCRADYSMMACLLG